MNTNAIQQEIILLTNTTFSQRKWCQKYSNKKGPLSHEEQLEEACWNGMLNELLPEIMERTATGQWLYMWHIRQSKSLIIDLSEFPVSIEKPLSIDPFFFLQKVLLN
jgi:hypothetical protein